MATHTTAHKRMVSKIKRRQRRRNKRTKKRKIAKSKLVKRKK